MDYFTALKRSGKILEAYFEQSRDILHNASKGTVREAILNKVIRPFLPHCYGLSAGEAFDSQGNVSKQLDLIVYDAMYSYMVPYNDDYIQFPCESIYGNIEIKSKLDKEEFNIAVENIASLKSLQRESTHPWTVMPQVQISINGKPDVYGRNKYFGIIFAYESVEVDTVMSYLPTIRDIPSAYRPNAIILLDRKTIILQGNNDKVEGFQQDDFNKYVAMNCGENVLAVFIGLLINYTRYSLLKAADVPSITNRELQNILNKNDKEGTILEVEMPQSILVEKDGQQTELQGTEAEEYRKKLYRAQHGF